MANEGWQGLQGTGRSSVSGIRLGRGLGAELQVRCCEHEPEMMEPGVGMVFIRTQMFDFLNSQ